MPDNPLAAPAPWDDIADGYDEVMTDLMRPFAVEALRLAAPTRSARIIDIATGPGTLALLAAPMVKEVVAVDFSEAMIRRLRHAVMRSATTNLLTGVGDGQALRYPSSHFDAAFSIFGLMFFPDRPRGFAELRRILRPGGTAVVSSWAPIADSTLMTRLYEAVQAGNPNFSMPQPNPANLENPEVFENELRTAGFTDVTVRPHTESFAYVSAQQMWDKLTRGSAPIHLMRSKTDPATWKAQEQTMIDHLSAHYTPGEELTTTAWLGTGRA
ncbi:class I SAM-dependent methyltransferase [Nocardia inohanensis]|uniref:class I SAM-dependent methyltransferase n=1 Tax=Nocardia inohanensis TaxID=209246 RepID=UPI00082A8479|nr:methyltransferase domain-containing protein [Nocardia inohanensis]